MLFFTGLLVLSRNKENLSLILKSIAHSSLGFIYLAILPSFAAKILLTEGGEFWYAFALTTVFAGDTGAYLTGMAIGKTKLVPRLSPKKTVEGALGGLAASCLFGSLWSLYFTEVPIQYLIIGGFFSGLFGQMGDFFESLLKRVADVKDSGNIMPGHGGLLDRIDGVLFALAPVYILLLFVQSLA